MIESWKKRLGLSLTERVALSTFSSASINNIVSDIHSAQVLELKRDLLKISEFLVYLGGIEHRLNRILSKVNCLAGLPDFKSLHLVEQLNHLNEIYEAGICPRGLSSLDYDLETLLKEGIQITNFRHRIGTGQVSMNDNDSWQLPGETMEKHSEAMLVCISVNMMLQTLQTDVNKEYNEKFGTQ